MTHTTLKLTLNVELTPETCETLRSICGAGTPEGIQNDKPLPAIEPSDPPPAAKAKPAKKRRAKKADPVPDESPAPTKADILAALKDYKIKHGAEQARLVIAHFGESAKLDSVPVSDYPDLLAALLPAPPPEPDPEASDVEPVTEPEAEPVTETTPLKGLRQSLTKYGRKHSIDAAMAIVQDVIGSSGIKDATDEQRRAIQTKLDEPVTAALDDDDDSDTWD